MSLYFKTGFEEFSTAQIEALWTEINLGKALTFVSGAGLGRRSGNCLAVETPYSGSEIGNWYVRAYDNSTKIYIGFALKQNNVRYSSYGLKVGAFNSLSGSAYHGFLEFEGEDGLTPRLSVTDATGTVQGTYYYDFTTRFDYYEIELDTAADTFKVWLNEEQIFDLTGDFSNTSTVIAYWGFGNSTYTRDAETYYIDDLYVDQSSRQGDLAIYYFPPTSDVAVAFTPSTGGDNYALVDEQPPSTSDYNESASIGDADIYGHGSTFGGAFGTVVEVAVVGYVNVPDVGVGSGILPTLRLSGVDYQEAAKTAIFTKKHVYGIFETNPATGAAFTLAELEALDGFGWEIDS